MDCTLTILSWVYFKYYHNPEPYLEVLYNIEGGGGVNKVAGGTFSIPASKGLVGVIYGNGFDDSDGEEVLGGMI